MGTSAVARRDRWAMSPGAMTVTPENSSDNVCEHGDHAAPMFERCCSSKCEECDKTPFDLIERCCAGICGKKGVEESDDDEKT